MDKNMIPLMLALAAIAAAGVTVAMCGEAPDGGSEIPSGYPPSGPGYNTEPVNPDEHPIQIMGYRLSKSTLDLTVGDHDTLYVFDQDDKSVPYNRILKWGMNSSACKLSFPDGYGIKVKALMKGECDITFTLDDYSCLSCQVTVSQ